MSSETDLSSILAHSAYGAAGAATTLTALSNLLQNLPRLVKLSFQVQTPSRNTLAIALFVGVYRFIEKYERQLNKPKSSKTISQDRASRASILPAILAIRYMDTSSRSTLISFLSANSLNSLSKSLREEWPSFLHYDALEYSIYILCSAWIMYAGFFRPDTFHPSYLQQLMRITLTSSRTASTLQAQYAKGVNISSCAVRHPHTTCLTYLLQSYLPLAVTSSAKIFLPVHLFSLCLSLRRSKQREKPVRKHMKELLYSLMRSTAFCTAQIVIGWTAACATESIGNRSLAFRKLQYFCCGALCGFPLLLEAPERRKPTAILLLAYALNSFGSATMAPLLDTVSVGHPAFKTVAEMIFAAAQVAYVLPTFIESNSAVRIALFGELDLKEEGEEVEAIESSTFTEFPVSQLPSDRTYQEGPTAYLLDNTIASVVLEKVVYRAQDPEASYPSLEYEDIFTRLGRSKGTFEKLGQTLEIDEPERVQLSPGKEMQAQYVEHGAHLFSVTSCQPKALELALSPAVQGAFDNTRASYFLLNTGDEFHVPAGNAYYLYNHSRYTTADLAFQSASF